MNKSSRMKIFGVCSVLFFIVCGSHIVKAYETNPKEAIFEGFLLATIGGYHAVLLRNLQQLPEEPDERKLTQMEN